MIRSYDDDLVPICEKCWIEDRSVWEPESVDQSGNIRSSLISVTVPMKLVPGIVNECFLCDKVTVVGLYVSIDEVGIDSNYAPKAESDQEDMLPEDDTDS